MVQVIFARAHHPGSVLLRTAMWSPWSHCGIIYGEYVIHAHAQFGGGKVIATKLENFKKQFSNWAIVNFEADAPIVHQAAYDQLNKPYDWAGVTGFVVHRNWHNQDAWFCSELVAWCLEQGGCKLFRVDVWRITPQHLWMLNYPIVEQKLAA